jgi:hypothetical protein
VEQAREAAAGLERSLGPAHTNTLLAKLTLGALLAPLAAGE